MEKAKPSGSNQFKKREETFSPGTRPPTLEELGYDAVARWNRVATKKQRRPPKSGSEKEPLFVPFFEFESLAAIR
jgi:hypothetical protein